MDIFTLKFQGTLTGGQGLSYRSWICFSEKYIKNARIERKVLLINPEQTKVIDWPIL